MENMKSKSVSIKAGGGGSLLSGCEAPAPVRESETGRARNWTIPPLRLEREWRERPNSATIDNRCVEFDRRENQRCAFTTVDIPGAERHPQSDPSEKLTIAVKQSELADDVASRTVSNMSSRIYFGICPTIPVARDSGQMLNQSCSTREKRHREKRGFRLVPLLARAVQGDIKIIPSLRAVVDRVAIPLSTRHWLTGSPRRPKGLLVMTPAEPVLCLVTNLSVKNCAFTMAEILLSLTIIGVVAAITLPSLTGNINERTWNTQRKTLYARFSQAIALMPSLNGYGTLTEESSSGAGDGVDTAAETFITNGLAKVLKINNICDSEHIEDCGITSNYINYVGSSNSMPVDLEHLNSGMISVDWGSAGTYSALNTKAAAFETANGESILLFYNPNCLANMGETGQYYSQPKMCANMVFDLNGSKGPNTFGKDKGFLTVFYPSDSVVVAPDPFSTVFEGVNKDNASKFCTEKTSTEYRLPTKEEVASVYINRQFINLDGINAADANLFTSTKLYTNGQTYTWILGGISGLYKIANSDNWRTVCVKR